MSIPFSDTANKDGLIQLIESNLGFNDGDISGNTTRLAKFTGEINLALDEVFSIIFNIDGTWQFDDSNHTDYPILTANIVSGQRDYTFTSDQSGNVILGIHKVMVADESGTFRTINPVDQQSPSYDQYQDGLSTSGLPNTYDKTANGIFLNPIPNYNETNGLKIFVDREASYFATTDTTKTPGFSGLFHEYLVLKPAYTYARTNRLPQMADLKIDMLMMRQAIEKYYGKRENDVERIITPKPRTSR